MATAVTPAHAAAPEFESSWPQARLDGENPAHQDWLQSVFAPALRLAVRESAQACGRLGEGDLQGFGFVLVLGRDGELKSLHWRDDSDWTRCVSTDWRGRRFPAPPKDDFHVGVVPPGATVPSPPGTAERLARQLKAPEVPEGMSCSADLQKPDVVRPEELAQAAQAGPGWTVVSFHLDGDGRPKSIQTDRSSGQAQLDRFVRDRTATLTYRQGVVRQCQERWMVGSN
jgi:hypothetical protein